MDVQDQLVYLRTTAAIREQCQRILAQGEKGLLPHFTYHPEQLSAVIDFVLRHIRDNYPNLDIPYHSRWRHFDARRLALLEQKLEGGAPEGKARSKVELAIVSVLLDAGAGMGWRYTDRWGVSSRMSEGLAAASFDMFLEGAFSSDPKQPLRVDAKGLKQLDTQTLAQAFQVTESNPLQGFSGRLALLHKLGEALESEPSIFGDREPRLGHIFDAIVASASPQRAVAAPEILSTVLLGLGSIWPGRITLGGQNLGDVWPHRALPKDDKGAGLVPFHKLSQWLSYSLAEPCEEAGYTITHLDQLTGLAEYRNGGLLLDLGLLSLRDPSGGERSHKPDSELIVEWRALTVSLLDRIAEGVRHALGKSALELPLAKVLQGGTWSAGRKIAAQKRSDGGPPLRLDSDGTVF